MLLLCRTSSQNPLEGRVAHPRSGAAIQIGPIGTIRCPTGCDSNINALSRWRPGSSQNSVAVQRTYPRHRTSADRQKAQHEPAAYPYRRRKSGGAWSWCRMVGHSANGVGIRVCRCNDGNARASVGAPRSTRVHPLRDTCPKWPQRAAVAILCSAGTHHDPPGFRPADTRGRSRRPSPSSSTQSVVNSPSNRPNENI